MCPLSIELGESHQLKCMTCHEGKASIKFFGIRFLDLEFCHNIRCCFWQEDEEASESEERMSD